MRVVVIGGTGHIGTYLVPSLVKAGHDTVVISRGSRRPYRDDPVWRDVEMMACDREAAEQAGQFGTLIGGLRPDAVVDLSPFSHSPSLPGGSAAPGTLVALTAVAAVLVAVGLAALGRRDISSGA